MRSLLASEIFIQYFVGTHHFSKSNVKQWGPIKTHAYQLQEIKGTLLLEVILTIFDLDL